MECLHQSKYFTIKQCDLKRCFLFEMDHKSVSLSFCQLIALRDRVGAIDIEAHFDDKQNKHGLEILYFCNREHLIILNTLQVIDLKSCIEATFALLQGAKATTLAE